MTAKNTHLCFACEKSFSHKCKNPCRNTIHVNRDMTTKENKELPNLYFCESLWENCSLILLNFESLTPSWLRFRAQFVKISTRDKCLSLTVDSNVQKKTFHKFYSCPLDS